MKPTTINCEVCKQPFVAKDPRRIYCSDACNARAQRHKRRALDPLQETKICDECRTVFKPYTKRNRFCSEKCHCAWGNKHKEYSHTCLGCNKPFVSRFPKGKYCTRSCALKHTIVTRTLVCVDCGNTFEFIGRTRKLRCVGCQRTYWNSYYSAATGGIDARAFRNEWRTHNPNWRVDNVYRRIVRSLPGEVRYKYRNICYDTWPRCCAITDCGSLEGVEVHHIDGDRRNYRLDNLVPLCKRHHGMVHTKPHKTQWTTDDYRASLFRIWPEGSKILGIIAQQCAIANIANSVNALTSNSRANAELGAQAPSVETIHDAPETGEDIVQTTN